MDGSCGAGNLIQQQQKLPWARGLEDRGNALLLLMMTTDDEEEEERRVGNSLNIVHAAGWLAG